MTHHPNAPKEITAELRDVYMYDGIPSFNGDIYGDVRKRFRDGYEIRTSRVLAIWMDPGSETKGIAQTQNSVYQFTLYTDADIPPLKAFPQSIEVFK